MKTLLIIITVLILPGCASPDYRVLFDDEVSAPNVCNPYTWGMPSLRYPSNSIQYDYATMPRSMLPQ